MSSFFSGSLDPSWPHAVLLTVAIIASFSVALGIVLENPKWSLANVLVVGGVAIEAVCTLLLFGFDEGISNSQQRNISVLESRLATRTLSAADIKEIAARLNKFTGQSFEIHSYVDDQESVDISDQISTTLVSAGWTPYKNENPFGILGVVGGLAVHIHDDASQSVKDAALELVMALNDKHIAAMLRPIHDSTPAERINVVVGIKP